MGLGVLFVGFLLSCALCVKGVEQKDSPLCAFPAIYNFGDSNSDTGGISAAFVPIPGPYGEGFFHKPSGRDCDGRLIIDFIGNYSTLKTKSPFISTLAFSFFSAANNWKSGVSFFFLFWGGVLNWKLSTFLSLTLLFVLCAAEKVKLPYLSAYLNSLGTNYRHGANFATGGSTIRKQNETIFEYGISPFSLDIQIIQFNQFKARTKQLYQEGESVCLN